MKRKFLSILLASASAFLVACATTSESNTAEVDSAVETHSVKYYDATDSSVLYDDQVEHGQTATEYSPEKDGYDFMGWYISPDLSRNFDFSTKIKADTEIYGGFAKYVDDTRTFYIVGSGKSELLAKSNWGQVIDDSFAMTKEENDKANVYTITVNLEKGDAFQFVCDSEWSDQRGFGYVDTGSLDGTEYLKGAGGLGDTPINKANIEVQVAGTYTFTLTTYPDADVYDTTDEYYSEDKKENFNSNPFDTITWTYAAD